MSADGAWRGQYLACHVEKRLLGYLYALLDKLQTVNPRKGMIYVDHPPCFDCLFFAAFFEIKTDFIIEIYYNGREYMAPRRRRLRFARNLLLNSRVASPILKDTLEGVQKKPVANQPEIFGLVTFMNESKLQEEWIEGFFRMNKGRREGKIQERKFPEIDQPVIFLDSSEDSEGE